MNNTKNDNRMSWIRTSEKLKNIEDDKYLYFYEFEILSEKRLTGVINYDNYIMGSPFTIEKNKDNLYSYLIRLKYHGFPNGFKINKNANKKGYYFPGGEIEEILALFSLFFQCRFYVLASYSGDLTENSMKIKDEFDFLHKKCNPLLHPTIFNFEKNKKVKRKNLISRNLGDISNFLDLVKSLKPEYHNRFALSCHHYHQALKEVGINQEMIFIRLVSAIECLLDNKENFLNDKDIATMFKKDFLSKLSKIDRGDLKRVLNNRKIAKRFVKFIMDYSKGFSHGGNYKANHCKISRKNLPEVLTNIYNARSNYLHNGDPMYISTPYAGFDDLDEDGAGDMIIDNKKYSADQKLPFPYFFENLIRYCLSGFLKSKIT